MQYKIITPVAVEPITLSEAKLHIRALSGDFVDDVSLQQSIAPGSHEAISSFGLIGSAINALGKEAVVSLNAGVCGAGGSVSAKIQESDDGVTWTDFVSFAEVTEDNDGSVQKIEYTGRKQFIRVVATVTIAACSFGADVLLRSGDVIEDDLIMGLIKTARGLCEKITRRALATQTIEFFMDSFPEGACIELPRPPLQSIESFKYKDYSGVETVMTADEQYICDADSDPGRVALPYGVSWPSFVPYSVNSVRIRYIAGYTEENPIPESIKQAMLLLVGHWYNNREAVLNLSNKTTYAVEIPFSVRALLAPYKVRWWV